jgi:hypothetical protein
MFIISVTGRPDSWLEIMREAANFESGFTGFIGLTITSLVWVGSLLLNAAFNARSLADALRIDEKRYIKYSSTNDHCAKNEDVLCNPVNPDSKPDDSR